MKKSVIVVSLVAALAVGTSAVIVSSAKFGKSGREIPLYELESSAYLEALKDGSYQSPKVSKEEEALYFQKVERYYQLRDENRKIYDSSSVAHDNTLSQYYQEMDQAALVVLQNRGLIDSNRTMMYYYDNFDQNDDNNEFVQFLLTICDTLNDPEMNLTVEEKTTLLYTLDIDFFASASDSKRLNVIYESIDFSGIPTFRNTSRSSYTDTFERVEESLPQEQEEESSR